LALLLHFKFDLAAVQRFLGGQHTAAHQDPDEILPQVQGLVSEKVFNDVKRIMCFGAPFQPTSRITSPIFGSLRMVWSRSQEKRIVSFLMHHFASTLTVARTTVAFPTYMNPRLSLVVPGLDTLRGSFQTEISSFGDNSSPPEFEPFAGIRTALGTNLNANGQDIVPEYSDYLDAIQFAPPPPIGTTFIQAHPDKFNPGVLDDNGNQEPTEYNMHVDDNLFLACVTKIISHNSNTNPLLHSTPG
jgi:hypothetical protein